jgi:hypothetical protein
MSEKILPFLNNLENFEVKYITLEAIEVVALITSLNYPNRVLKQVLKDS